MTRLHTRFLTVALVAMAMAMAMSCGDSSLVVDADGSPPDSECLIEATADGAGLDPGSIEVPAGTEVTLRAVECGSAPTTTFQWTTGGPDTSVLGEGPEFTVQAFGPNTFTLLVFEDGIQIESLSITIDVTPTAIISSITINDFKPTQSQTVILEVQTLQGTVSVPIMDAHPEVTTIDWTVVRLVDFVPADVVVSAAAETTSNLTLPGGTLDVGWYQVTAFGKNTNGDVLAAPSPLQFEVVP